MELLLACEAPATVIGFCSPLFVTGSDVIFRCEMKRHCFNPHFRYSVAALPITSITLRPTKSKSKCQQESGSHCLDSLLLGLDFGATHQPRIWHVQTPQR